MDDFDLSKASQEFQKQMLAVQEQTLKKAQAEIGLKTENLKWWGALLAVIAIAGGVIGGAIVSAKDIRLENQSAEIKRLEQQLQQLKGKQNEQ